MSSKLQHMLKGALCHGPILALSTRQMNPVDLSVLKIFDYMLFAINAHCLQAPASFQKYSVCKWQQSGIYELLSEFRKRFIEESLSAKLSVVIFRDQRGSQKF